MKIDTKDYLKQATISKEQEQLNRSLKSHEINTRISVSQENQTETNAISHAKEDKKNTGSPANHKENLSFTTPGTTHDSRWKNPKC